MTSGNITFVSPGLYLHGKDVDWESAEPKPGFVPILKSDVPRFEKSLGHLNKNRGKAKETVELDSSQVQSSTADDTAGEINRFVDIKAFLPISLDQQLHTVCLKNVPIELDKKGINKMLEKLENMASTLLPGKSFSLISQWSMLDSVDSLSLFIKFESLHEYGNIIKFMRTLFDAGEHSIRIHMDENTKRFVEAQTSKGKEMAPNTNQIQEMDTLISLLKNESRNKEARKGNAIVEYKVDMNTLSDLPNSSLDQLCEDIVEFRTRVLTLEKEKRDKEAIEEEKQRKHHLKQIFEKIKNSNTQLKSGEQAEEEDDEDDEDDDNDDDGWGNDDDEEKNRLQHERDQQDAVFNDLLKQFDHTVLSKLKSLKHDLNQLKNHESHINKNRGVYLKELLHLASDPYFDHHRQFRDTEIEKDRVDREQEEQEIEQFRQKPQPSSPESISGPEKPPQVELEEPKIKLALKQILKRKPIEEPAVSPPSEFPTSSLPQEEKQLVVKVQTLRQSGIVDELVKEYLGVYEPDLVDYILQSIEENQSKDALQKELAETFDEDSPMLVARIWNAL